MSPRPSTCDGFTGNLPSYSDRELGPAECSALEKHLEGCVRCQGRLKELESVSDVLKGWDAGLPAGQTAGARLQHAVLGRIEEDGQRRRREVLGVRVRRFALAAAVLLAVGLPLAFGLGAPRAGPEDRPVVFVAVTGPDAPRPARDGEFPALAPVTLAPEALVHAPLADAPEGALPEPLPAEQRDALLALGLQAQRELEQEAHFRQRVGIRGVWVVDPGSGSRLLVTPEAAQVFGAAEPATGMLHLPTLYRLRDEPYTGPPLTEPGDLGKTPGDLFRSVLGDAPQSARGTMWHLGTPLSAQHQLSAIALPARANSARADTLDPLAAQSLGLLRFAPSGSALTTLVAIVEGNDLPIFLPAGQILTGGETDRVIARPIWLPAAKTRSAYPVPCAVVRQGQRRGEDGIALTPWVAGPTLRALLTRGASAQVILDHVRTLRGAAGSLDWSLLDLYLPPKIRAMLDSPKMVDFAEHASAGFLVMDARSRFLGLEHLALSGEVGAAHCRRLLLGYAIEGLHRAVTPGAASPATETLTAALHRLRETETTLRLPPVPPLQEVPGVVRGTLADDSGAYEALRVEGHSVWVAALPGDKPSAR